MKKYTINIVASETFAAKIDYAAHLNQQQYEVVTQADGPVLVLAGAGSGKTRTLVYRVAYLLEKGINPQNILLVTFTNKAAREMTTRVEKLLGAKPKGLTAGTFHHVGNLSLRKYAKHLGFTPEFGILDEEDSRHLIKACMDTLKIKTTERRFPQPQVVGSIISYTTNSKKKIEDVVVKKYPHFFEVLEELEKVHSLYTRKKRESNSMDYDDLLTKWIELLSTVPEAKERYQGQFKYVLVDEYQDTNILQHEVIKLISGQHGNVLVVGDDAQAIYSFRAADINNILNFPSQYPGTKIFKLETNYRSTPQILNLANNSISNNKAGYPKKLKSVMDKGILPAFVQTKDVQCQSAFIAQRVLELRDQGVALEDMAVLFRARYQAAELELELVKRGIPYVLRGGVRFFEQAHIKDVLSYLRILANPRDEISWKRALGLEEGIGKVTAEQLWQSVASEGFDLEKILSKTFLKNIPKRAQNGWLNFTKILGSIIAEKNNPSKQIEQVLKSGYKKYLLSAFDNAKDREDDLEELANFAFSHKNVEDFLSEITLREGFKGEGIVAGPSSDNEHLVLSTIHQAKGLEWHAVFILGASEGHFPHLKSIEDPAEFEEERRLFYVASTRAKKELYMVHPILRYDHSWGEIITRPSVFIQELPESCYEKWHTEENFFDIA